MVGLGHCAASSFITCWIGCRKMRPRPRLLLRSIHFQWPTAAAQRTENKNGYRPLFRQSLFRQHSHFTRSRLEWRLSLTLTLTQVVGITAAPQCSPIRRACRCIIKESTAIGIMVSSYSTRLLYLPKVSSIVYNRLSVSRYILATKATPQGPT